MSHLVPEERDFLVRGVRIRAKLWNPEGKHRLIALHGWLDNAASFDRLAPLLHDCAVLALDLPGQGFSDWRQESSTYHLWDDLVDILQIANALQWKRFALLGHSRGAMLSVMLAASSSDRVSQMFLIDGLTPLPVLPEKAPEQLGRFLQEIQQPYKSSRVFSSKEEAVKARAAAGKIPESVADLLAVRNLQSNDGGWVWHVDPRLKVASALKLSTEQNHAFLAAVRCPVTVFLADGGFGSFPGIEEVVSRYPHFSWQRLSGHHHLHMDDAADEIAGKILERIGQD